MHPASRFGIFRTAQSGRKIPSKMEENATEQNGKVE
jgi:hypothetical protein